MPLTRLKQTLNSKDWNIEKALVGANIALIGRVTQTPVLFFRKAHSQVMWSYIILWSWTTTVQKTLSEIHFVVVKISAYKHLIREQCCNYELKIFFYTEKQSHQKILLKYLLVKSFFGNGDHFQFSTKNVFDVTNAEFTATHFQRASRGKIYFWADCTVLCKNKPFKASLM